MRFLFDQSADFRLIPHLNDLNHDVQAISRDYPGGLPDEKVLAIARDEQRIVITFDHDFGNLVFQEGLAHAGIILIRLPSATLHTMLERLDYLLTHYVDQLDQFVALTERGVRVRRRSP